MFFRKTGFKIAGTILCILSLTVSILSSYLVLLLLSTGVYDGSGRLFDRYAYTMMDIDANEIMHAYFDPNDPTHPWESYYSGGIYTGEDSNFLYDITDIDTGYSVLSTVKGGEPVLMRQDFGYSFDTELTQAPDNIPIIGSRVFRLLDSIYVYDNSSDVFLPMADLYTEYFTSEVDELPEDVLRVGFIFEDTYYDFDGDQFTPGELPTEQVVEQKSYTITCYLRYDLPYNDRYQTLYELAQTAESLRYWLIAIAGVGLVLTIVLLCLLGCAVGRRPGQEAAYLPLIFRLPSDALLLAVVIAIAAGLSMTVSIYNTTYFVATTAFNCAIVLIMSAIAVYFILHLCARAKTHTLISGSFVYWCIRNLGRFGRALGRLGRKALGYLPLVWKVMVCYAILCLLEFIGIVGFSYGYSDMLLLLWVMEKLLLGAAVMYVALALNRLKKGAESIAAGDYNTKVEETHLVLDFKDCADTLNHIQDGMNAAVDSRMRSEHLKTELITNVSHDLKTPLTSIVSYVDLLKQEPMGSQAAGEYLEVLDRQSARLKKLIEDLVEASKASTGNIPVEKAPLDVGMLLGQAMGEYNQRLEQAGLTPVLRLPETPCMVSADGRLLWRVFDNLLGNIVKYAMPGTRVYLTVEVGDTITAAFRNISREPLEVSADELMERFVRGDASRHTEGSGLGLSIARSLTDSMGGTFGLSLDGDLFKAMVSFPGLEPETE